MSHSALVNYILNQRTEEFPIESIRKIESGQVFNKLESKGKFERRLFCVQLDIFRIVWVSDQRDQIEGVVYLRDLKEVRIGKNAKLFDQNKCFTLYFGKKFRLKELCGFGKYLGQYIIE